MLSLCSPEQLQTGVSDKEQKAMYRADVHFGFGNPFFACPIGYSSKIAHPKSWAHRRKLVQPCLSTAYSASQRDKRFSKSSPNVWIQNQTLITIFLILNVTKI